MTSNKDVDCSGLLEDEYCPYDRVSIWCQQDELLKRKKQFDESKTNLDPEDIEDEKFGIIYQIRRQIVWINFSLRWLEKVAKPDGWQMYDHDMDELLWERKALIDAFYALNPDAYLQFLTIVPEIKDFPYWDPLQQIVSK